jgi:hypothetical protein
LGPSQNLLTVGLPAKAIDATAGQTLLNMFPSADIGQDGSTVRASAVLKLYNVLYDRIIVAGSQEQHMEPPTNISDLQAMQGEITSLRGQLRTVN